MRKRAYVSPLREDQLEGTRVRIVEAVARVLARGLVELSVPAVAKEAGVSVATVYRHFPTKTDLVRGLAEHVGRLRGTGLENFTLDSLDDLESMWRSVLQKAAQLDPALREAMASQEVNRLRRETRELRLAGAEKVLAPHLDHLPAGDRRRVRDLLVVLMSSATANAFEMLVGTSPEETAATLAWAAKRVIGPNGAA